jgi:hypothetical protein
MKRTVRIAATMVAFALVCSSAAYAQATRTWVSGVGDDVNPCSRTAPCKTFAGAISKTAAGGEISVLDPGGYGGVNITKSITINGTGTLAGVLTSGPVNGIIINAGASDVVTLRNISIHGHNGALSGVRYVAGGTLILDNVDIENVTTGVDVEPTGSATAKAIINNCTIRGTTNGIQVTGVNAHVVVDRTAIRNASTGIDAQNGSVSVTRSTLANNTFIAFFGTAGNHTLHDSLVSNNNIGVQAQAAATVSVSDNSIVDNLFGFGCGGGTLASTGDNRMVDNPSPGCSPGAVITVQ